MGPRSDERGNEFKDGHLEYEYLTLQWGRARMSAEIAAIGTL